MEYVCKDEKEHKRKARKPLRSTQTDDSPVDEHNPIPLPAAVLLLELKVKHAVSRRLLRKLIEEIFIGSCVVGARFAGRDFVFDDNLLVVVEGEFESLWRWYLYLAMSVYLLNYL